MKFCLFVGLACAIPAAAAQEQFEFTGRISRVVQDDAGLIQANGWGENTPVEFRWGINLAAGAYVIQSDGTRLDLPDQPQPGGVGNLYVDRFEATLLGGTYLLDPAAEAPGVTSGNIEWHVGSHDTSAGLNGLSLRGGGASYSVTLSRDNAQGWVFPPPMIGQPNELPWGFTYDSPRPENWKVGDTFRASSSALDASGKLSGFEAEVTLTAISAVPEPQIWTLFLTGCGGLGFAMRRHRVRR